MTLATLLPNDHNQPNEAWPLTMTERQPTFGSSSSSCPLASSSTPSSTSSSPLPLSEIRERVSEKTFRWLEQAEKEEELRKAEEAENETGVDLFASSDNDDTNDGDEDCRVHEWISSLHDPDGVGGIFWEASEDHAVDEHSADTVRVQYILSPSSGGHGDDLWAASRHIRNLFADPMRCRELLKMEPQEENNSTDEGNGASRRPLCPHPLRGKRFCELGAGGGLPSWVALWCGSNVVCTDQAIPDRIRCLAESAERNLRSIVSECKRDRQDRSANATDKELVDTIGQATVCPYDWGTPVDDMGAAFDVVVAADCCYMPECHGILLDSIVKLLAPNGIALLPFALHSNTTDERVWAIVDKAAALGLRVENLGAVQLTPQASGMPAKRALVHMVRLTWER